MGQKDWSIGRKLEETPKEAQLREKVPSRSAVLPGVYLPPLALRRPGGCSCFQSQELHYLQKAVSPVTPSLPGFQKTNEL